MMMTEQNIMLNVYVHMSERSNFRLVCLCMRVCLFISLCVSDIRANSDFVFLSIARRRIYSVRFLFFRTPPECKVEHCNRVEKLNFFQNSWAMSFDPRDKRFRGMLFLSGTYTTQSKPDIRSFQKNLKYMLDQITGFH